MPEEIDHQLRRKYLRGAEGVRGADPAQPARAAAPAGGSIAESRRRPGPGGGGERGRRAFLTTVKAMSKASKMARFRSAAAWRCSAASRPSVVLVLAKSLTCGIGRRGRPS